MIRNGLLLGLDGVTRKGEERKTIGTADKVARALGSNLWSMFSELERNHDAFSTTDG
jgi:hypothetical protein